LEEAKRAMDDALETHTNSKDAFRSLIKHKDEMLQAMKEENSAKAAASADVAQALEDEKGTRIKLERERASLLSGKVQAEAHARALENEKAELLSQSEALRAASHSFEVERAALLAKVTALSRQPVSDLDQGEHLLSASHNDLAASKGGSRVQVEESCSYSEGSLSTRQQILLPISKSEIACAMPQLPFCGSHTSEQDKPRSSVSRSSTAMPGVPLPGPSLLPSPQLPAGEVLSPAAPSHEDAMAA